jgi:anti-sigma B factor antagonist
MKRNGGLRMPLYVHVQEKSRGVYTVYPEGSVDTNTYTILKSEIEKIMAQSPRLIIFDMEEVEFISSAGVGVILIAEQSAKAQGGGTFIVHLQPQIKKVFDILKALPEEQIFESIDELDRYLAEIQKNKEE